MATVTLTREPTVTNIFPDDQEFGPSETVLRRALQPGEIVIAYAEGLVRVLSPLFERCSVALTDRRILMAQQVWVQHWSVTAELDLSTTELANSKRRVDGSQLIVLQGEERPRCLYFSRRWEEEANLIRKALSLELHRRVDIR